MDVRVGLWRKLSAEKLMLFNYGFGEDSWASLGLQGDPTSPSWRRSVLGVHWKDWWWSWNSNTLATSCEVLTHWKRAWCWEGLGAGGEGDDRGWDGWMASLTRWAWVWVNSGVGDGQGGLACCDSWGRKESDTTEGLNWTELNCLTVWAHGTWLMGLLGLYLPFLSLCKSQGIWGGRFRHVHTVYKMFSQRLVRVLG